MDSFALTPSQMQIWKSQAISPDKPLFNQVMTVRLSVPHANEDTRHALMKAWRSTQKIHRVLGSVIVVNGEMIPRQQYCNTVNEMDQVNLAANDKNADKVHANGMLAQWISDRGARVFRLDEKLTDAVLLHYDDQQLMIFLNMHHLIADALSTQWVLHTLIQEFELACAQPPVKARSESAEINSEPFEKFSRQVTGNYAIQSKDGKAGISNSTSLPLISANLESSDTTSQTTPAFYGVVNSRPVTHSTRMRLDMANDQLAHIYQLADDPQLRLLNKNLFQMCFHTSALALYLFKCTGENRLVIEAPLSGRFEPIWKHTVGNLIEMVRIDIEVSSKETLLELYQRVRSSVFKTIQGAYAGCTRDLQSGRVHGVVNFITGYATKPSTLISSIDWHHSGHSDTHHPIRLHVADWKQSGTHTLDVDFNLGFFAENHLTTAIEHLKLAYQALITNRDTTINEVSLISNNEIWQLHGEPPRFPSDRGQTLIECIDTVTRQFPNRKALQDETDHLDYINLYKQSVYVAQFLSKHGIVSQHKIAVLMRRGIRLPIILLGIVRCGAIFIPLDHDQPEHRLREIIRDAGADYIINDGILNKDAFGSVSALTADQIFDGYDPTAWNIDSETYNADKRGHAPGLASDDTKFDDSSSVAYRPDPSTTAIQSTNTAYIIFTSGSTGKPKGVVISHSALMSYLGWANRHYQLQEPIVMPLHTSIGFDMTITSLFLPFINGGTLKVFTQTKGMAQSNALSLFEVMHDSHLNTIKLTPSHIALLEGTNTVNPSVKQIIVGGEDLKNSTAQVALTFFGGDTRIINEYGPSEATVGCITHDWNKQVDSHSVPIGRPIEGMSAYVLDDNQMPQFEGMPGELYLSGQSLADGYWCNQDETDRVFIDNPWVADQFMYRTGDLVRVRDNRLEYLGRKDTQIKRNGYRIELSEVESTLAKHPSVSHCAVVLESTKAKLAANGHLSDKETHCRLCGLSSSHPQGNLNHDKLCDLCASFLPNKSRINEYFHDTDELQKLIVDIKNNSSGKYDAVVLLSGGKDSTYAIARLVDMGLKVYAFSLDNGFISDQAKDNIDKVCQTLNIDHVYASTEHMNDIFVDSLTRYSNVCHGCFKTIYTLSMQFAQKHGIKTIFTGLSRGQLFETRLNNELFSDHTLPLVKIDEMVQSARIQYHAYPDAPNRLLAVDSVNSGELVQKIAIVDFYRYCHVELADMIHYLKERVGWIRPPDTGRSTNCLINDVGIHVHKIEQGFHNYSLPYSWDVRLGHKQREEALEELDDDIDIARVNTILNTIGYKVEPKSTAPDSTSILAAFVCTKDDIDAVSLRTWMEQRLPLYMQPDAIEFLDQLPLNANGKIDRKRLVRKSNSNIDTNFKENNNLSSLEKKIANVWQSHISIEIKSSDDNFFKLGGDSLSAIRCVVELRKQGYTVEPADLFRNPTLKFFTSHLSESPQSKTAASPSTATTKKFSALNEAQQEKLKSILGKRV